MFQSIHPVTSKEVVRPAQPPSDPQASADDIFIKTVAATSAPAVEKRYTQESGGTEQPRFGEADGERAVLPAEVPVEIELLSGSTLKWIGQGKIIHGETHRAHESIPFGISGGQIRLVGGFLFDIYIQIDFAIIHSLYVWYDIGKIVEDSHFPNAASQLGYIERVARVQDKFPAEDFFVSFAVSFEIDSPHLEFIAFDDIVPDVHLVFPYRHLGWCHLGIDIPFIIIQVSDSFQSGIEFFLIVDVAGLERELFPDFVFTE